MNLWFRRRGKKVMKNPDVEIVTTGRNRLQNQKSAISFEKKETETGILLLMLLLFSCSVVSDSLRPHQLQHSRLPCPPLSPGVCSNSCPLGQCYYLSISSSAAPAFFCPQSFPAYVGVIWVHATTEAVLWICVPELMFSESLTWTSSG